MREFNLPQQFILEPHFSPYDVPNGPGNYGSFDDGQEGQGSPGPDERGDQPEERRERIDQPDGEDGVDPAEPASQMYDAHDRVPEDMDQLVDSQPVTFSVTSAVELASQRPVIQNLTRDGFGPDASDAKVAYVTEAIMDARPGVQTVLAHDDETDQPIGAMTIRPHPVGDGGSIVWQGVDEAFMQAAEQWAEAHGVPLQAGYVQAAVVASDRQGEGIASEMLRMADSGYMPAVWVAVTRNPQYAIMQSHVLGDEDDEYRTFIGDRQEITPGNVQETTVHHAVTEAWMRAFAGVPGTTVHMDAFALSGPHEERNTIQTSSLPHGVKEVFERFNDLQQGLDEEGGALLVVSIRAGILDKLGKDQASTAAVPVDKVAEQGQKVAGEPSTGLFVRTPVVHQDLPGKPQLEDMAAYFEARLHVPEPGASTVITERDPFGNIVYLYPGIREETLAGESPATIVISPEGQHLIERNPTLMQDLHSGTLNTTGPPFDTRKSMVYRVSLQGEAAEGAYAVKYVFPRYERRGDSYDHTSGVMAMRAMYYAKQEQPVPHITYVTPIVATHDITITPFVHEGVSVDSFLSESLPNAHHLSADQEQQLREMQASSRHQEAFLTTVRSIARDAGGVLDRWTHGLIRRHPEFQRFHLHDGDASLRTQGVISISGIYEVYKRFTEDPTYRGERLEEDVLRNIAVVELLDGYVELPGNG